MLLFATAFGKASPCYGWNGVGHMTVAGLAYDELPRQQQDRLAAVLKKKHPKLNFITGGFPDQNVNGRDLVMAAATWPDLARGHALGKNAEIKNNGYEEKDPPITRAKFDGLLHPGWHFVDTPLWVDEGPPPGQLPPAPPVNAVGVVKVLIAQLKSNEDDAAKAYDLAWLMHLVGDLHQPVHCVNGISKTFPNGDRGGNEITINGINNGEHELHAFWDDVLGKKAAPDRKTSQARLDKDVATADEVIGDVQGLPLSAAANNLDPATWASESFQLAKRDAYDLQLLPFRLERPNSMQSIESFEATLNADYGAVAKQDAKRQVRMAGHRLASLLEDILQ
jgi:hypothetical protein